MRIVILLFVLFFVGYSAANAQDKKPKKKTEKKSTRKKTVVEEKAIEIEAVDIEQLEAIQELDKELIKEKKKKKGRRKKSESQISPIQDSVSTETIKDQTKSKKEKKSKIKDDFAGAKSERKNPNIAPEKPRKLKKQKKQKIAVKLSKDKKEEYPFYAERLFSTPDSADISIRIPPFNQKNKDEVRFTKAIQLINDHFPDKAIVILNQLYLQNPQNPNINYWLGQAYRQSYSGGEKALGYFKKASERTDFDYNFKKPQENQKAPVSALYYLATSYHRSGDIDNARRTYQMYIGVTKKGDTLSNVAQLNLIQIENATKLLAETSKDIRIRIAGAVNSFYDDFAAVMTNDGSELFFTSNRPKADGSDKLLINYLTGKYFDDIYISRINGAGKWDAPKPFSLNTTDNERLSGISPNSRILSIHTEGDTYVDYFESTFAFDAWQDPIEILPESNTLKWGPHFSVSPDRNKVYFASSKMGGLGGSDLYMVERKPDGSWTKPLNLGNKINSKYNEDMPFIHPNGQILFFSSDGDRSMGGYDIMKSNFIGEWDFPENIGSPINTFADDLYFTLGYDGKTAFYSKQDNTGLGGLDIYQINYTSGGNYENPKIQANFNVDLKNLDNSTEVEITNVLTREKKIYKPNIRTRIFTVNVEPCTKYTLAYRKQGVNIRTEEFTSPCENKK